MSNPNYQKEYKKSYKDKNKIVTFPLSVNRGVKIGSIKAA